MREEKRKVNYVSIEALRYGAAVLAAMEEAKQAHPDARLGCTSRLLLAAGAGEPPL